MTIFNVLLNFLQVGLRLMLKNKAIGNKITCPPFGKAKALMVFWIGK